MATTIHTTWLTVPQAAEVLSVTPGRVRQMLLDGTIEGEPLGEYTYRKWGTTLAVTAFLMRVTTEDDDWDEADFRDRRWCGAGQASSLIERPKLQRLLEAAISRLAKK